VAGAWVVAALIAAPNVPTAARPFPTTVPAGSVVVVVSPVDMGQISPQLFGSNLLWPYNAEGAFDPLTDNFYPTFVREVRQLGVTALRYPAGITADSFDWLRAIGPHSRRLPNEPYAMQAAMITKRCCALDGPALSTVGPDEFGKLLGETGSVGDVIVNFVTGTAQEAADFVAYMTAPVSKGPSSRPSDAGYWASLRAANGHSAPYDVPYWEVGNEQNGPYQYGWRSGQAVKIGPHIGRCTRWEVATCLYAFGGTTAFFRQTVGTFADDERLTSYSTGRPNQTFFVYFPPVVPRTQTVYVAGQRWWPLGNLAVANSRSRVYRFDPSDGEITFGNGRHGAVPSRGAEITVSYSSGPHQGFVEFYDAMKKMSPRVHICETE
jgi:alpha-N-arabinofuranosidase